MSKDEQELRAEGERLLASGMPSESGQAMVGMHEMYGMLKEGGFSKLEALWLVGYMITGGAQLRGDDQ